MVDLWCMFLAISLLKRASQLFELFSFGCRWEMAVCCFVNMRPRATVKGFIPLKGGKNNELHHGLKFLRFCR